MALSMGMPERIQSALHKQILARLVEVRVAAGLTLAQFAKKAGLSKQSINGWQHGSSPTVESLEGCARAVGGRLYVRVVTEADRVTDLPSAGGPDLRTDEAAELAAMVDDLPPDARQSVLEAAYAAQRAYYRRKSTNPLEPAEVQGSPHGRRT